MPTIDEVPSNTGNADPPEGNTGNADPPEGNTGNADPPEGNTGNADPPEGNTNTNEQTGSSQPGWGSVCTHLLANKVECCMWLSRIATVVFSLMYALAFYGRDSSYSFYQRALICNALTSALRLHQRMPNFQFTRQYLAMLLIEDSCHNLLYSLIFINGSPITISLIPVFLFSILHSANYTKKLLDKAGPRSVPVLRNLISKLVSRQTDILRIIALNEVLLFPFLIFMLFYGKASLLSPFMYFNFVVYRYASRRNPYTRQIMGELRLKAENFANRPSTPGIFRTIIARTVSFLSRFAPATQYQG